MDPLTIRVSSDTVDAIDDEADEQGLSRAAYLREILETRNVSDEVRSEYEQKLAEYEEKLSERDREIDRLRAELRAANARQDDVGEIVEYVDREKHLRERERERRDAPIWRRLRWSIFGRSDED